MQYTVWSGDRQIGVTDLGFLYREGAWRTGWFYPGPDCEPLMPDIVDPLIGNYIDRRRGRRSEPEPMSADDLRRLAEYEKACQRAAEWHLRLRRDDGSLIPTESVGIRDMEALMACYPDDDETWEDELDGAFDFDFDDDESEAWKRGGRDASEEEALRALRRDIEHDVKLIDQWMEDDSRNHQWTPDDDEPLPRYQIMVSLLDPSDVP